MSFTDMGLTIINVQNFFSDNIRNPIFQILKLYVHYFSLAKLSFDPVLLDCIAIDLP